jgi:nucleotide-binding universal stress UspA family protein
MVNILFPTDFSKAAENAFLYALQLTKVLDANLTLAHVYELPELGRALHNTSKEVYELMEMETLENFNKSIKELRQLAEDKGYGDVSFKHIMAAGQIVPKVANIAEHEKIDYIVMGTTGASGLKEIFLGSIASGVIDIAPCRVLSIPEQTNPTDKIDKVAYLTNYKDEEVVSFDQVVAFAKKFDASIYCVHYDKHVTDVSQEQMTEWKNKLHTEGLMVSFDVITGEDFEHSLVDYYEAKGIDIISIQPRRRNLFSAIFKKSNTKSIAQHLKIPLLSLSAK